MLRQPEFWLTPNMIKNTMHTLQPYVTVIVFPNHILFWLWGGREIIIYPLLVDAFQN
jgi:hypothetical protein